MMRQRWVNRLLLVGGVLLTAALWDLLLLVTVYEAPLNNQGRILAVLIVGTALALWLGPDQRVDEERDWLWLGTLLEVGLLVGHLPLVPWIVLQAPALALVMSLVTAGLGWVVVAALRRLWPGRLAFRPVHALLCATAGLVAGHWYLLDAPAPLFCHPGLPGEDGRALFSFTEGCSAEASGLCALPAARIAHLGVTADGRFLVGTAEQGARAGMFRVRLDAPGTADFVPLPGMAPRGLVPFDHGREFLVPTDSRHNALLRVSVEPFALTRRDALVPESETIEVRAAVAPTAGHLLLLPREGARGLEVNLTTGGAESREVPVWRAGLVRRMMAAADPLRSRLFVGSPFSPYLIVSEASSLTPLRDLPGGLLPSALAVSPTARRVYVADYLLGRVRSWDADSLLARGQMSLGFSVHRLAVAPDGRSLAGGGLATGRVVQGVAGVDRPVRTWNLGRLVSALHWSAATDKLYAASRCGVYELSPVVPPPAAEPGS